MRNALWVWVLALAACAPTREQQCAKVREKIGEEVRAVSTASPKDLTTAAGMEAVGKKLKGVSDELKAMEVRDPDLQAAVKGYLTALDGLAEGYARGATSNAGLNDLFAKGDTKVISQLGSSAGLLMVNAATIIPARDKVEEVCRTPAKP
jgi:hypothetical protein